MLCCSAVLDMASCSSLCVCLSQVGVLANRLGGSRWFLARGLPSTALKGNSCSYKNKGHVPLEPVAYLGGGTGRCPPPLWPEHKNFLNTLNQKKFLKFLGKGHSPLPRPLLQWGGDTPSPHSTPLAPPAPRTSRLWLCPPLDKILNTPLSGTMSYILDFEIFATACGSSQRIIYQRSSTWRDKLGRPRCKNG